MKFIYVLSVLLIMALPTSGQTANSAIQDKDKDGDYLLPGKNLIVDGVPEVPKEFGKIYDDLKGTSYSELLGWRSNELELLTVYYQGASQPIQAVSGPGEKGRKLFEISPEGIVYSYSNWFGCRAIARGPIRLSAFSATFTTNAHATILGDACELWSATWKNIGSLGISGNAPRCCGLGA